MKKFIGRVGVDSGNIIILDPCYIKHHEALTNPEKWGDFVKARHAGENPPALEIFDGIVSRTNYGDGSYPVYVTFDDEGKPTKLEIDFVEKSENL